MMKNTFYKSVVIAFLVLTFVLGTIPLGVGGVIAHATDKPNKTSMSVGNSRFSINISYGIDGMVKLNSNMPIHFDITNNGDDFQGAVYLVSKESYSQTVTKFAREVSIANGEMRSVSMLMPDNADSLSVELRDTRDKLLYKKKFAGDLLEKTTFTGNIYGILSDNYQDLNYLDGAMLHVDEYKMEYDVKIGELDENTFPDMAKALFSCNAIIIDNYDTSKLSDEQKEALVGYVNAGGLLIVSTGAEYNKVLSGLPTELISGNVGGVKSENVTFNYYDTGEVYVPVDYGTDDVAESNTATVNKTNESVDINEVGSYHKATMKLDVADISVDGADNVEVLSNIKDLIKVKYYGQGAVVVTGFSIGRGGFAENESARVNIIDNLVNYVATENIKSSISNGYITSNVTALNPNESIITMSNQSKRPKVWIYLIVLLIYILLAGPIGYLILKKLDKRKLMWVVIPALSLLFVIIMYLVSINQVVRRPSLDYIAVDELNDGSVKETVYTSIATARKGKCNIDFKSEYTNLQRLNSGMDYFNSGIILNIIADMTNSNVSTSDVVFWEKTDHSMITKESTQAFDSVNIQAETTFAYDGDIATELTLNSGKFDGGVTNNTGFDLKYVIVSDGMGCYYFDSISKGETVKLADAIKVTDTYSIASTVTGGYYGYDVAGLFNKRAAKDKYRKYTILSNMSDLLGDQIYNSTGRGKGIVCAFVDGDERDIVDNKKIDQYGSVFLFKEFSISYSGDASLVEANINNNCMESCDGDFDGSSGTVWGSDVTATYGINKNEINTLINFGYVSDDTNMYAECMIYNNSTSNWEPLFDNPDDEEFRLSDDYIYHDGSSMRDLFKIRYTSNNTNDGSMYAPIIGGGYKNANN